MTVLAHDDLVRFAAEVEQRLGLALDLERDAADIAAALRDRLRATSSSGVDGYLARMAPAEVSALADRLTVGETYFFRYAEQIEALSEALPSLVGRRGGPLRLLSAACSSGEEAGTLAIVLRSVLPEAVAGACTILGVDVSPAAIQKAKRGRYGEWSLRHTPAAIRARWFHACEGRFELDLAARAMLSFAEKNLAEPDDELWRPGAYDVIFYRNALMYFSDEAALASIGRAARALAPGGLLFVGPTETHLARATGLALRQARDAFYHQRVEGSDTFELPTPPSAFAARTPLPFAPAAGRLTPLPFATPLVSDEHLRLPVEFRVPVEAEPRPPAPAEPRRPAETASSFSAFPESAAPPDPASLTRAVDFFREDRITDALMALPPGGDGDPEAQLLRGVLLSSSGDVPGAERACQAVLALDPLHAGARYLLALCCEYGGDAAGAVEHDRAAIYLDARFAMPHLHLGSMLRRRGDVAEAARELRQAAALLAEEDEARVVLFGGGLRREALIERCRMELAACGVKR